MLGLTSFQIKCLAAGFMVIDHAGRLLFDDAPIMLAIGRLSFPLFAWLATQGEQHTSNFRNYLLRLIIAGLITQPIYLYFLAQIRDVPFTGEIVQWNMLFALAYGVWAVRQVKQQEDPIMQWIMISVLAIVAQFLRLEGGYITALSIYAMSLLGKHPIAGYGLFVALHLLYLVDANGFSLELLAILGPLICLRHNGEQGPKAQWFYSFYPLHFTALLLLKLYVLPLWWPQITALLSIIP
jgi:drug/metabolite transporter superfamily protein YnfA